MKKLYGDSDLQPRVRGWLVRSGDLTCQYDETERAIILQAEPESRGKIYKSISTKFGIAEQGPTSPLSQIQAAYRQQFDAMGKELRHGLVTSQRQTEEIRTATHKLLDTLSQSAEKFAAGTKKKLEADYKRRESELSDREVRLNQVKEELNRRSADLDLDDSRQARRKLRDQLLDSIRENTDLDISKGTAATRKPVKNACLALAVLAVGGMAYFGAVLSKMTNPSFIHLLPFSTSTLILLTTAAFYLRWTNRWSDKHSEVEFSSHSLKVDVLRANWLAEMLFEWDKDKQGEFPQEVLTAFSRNLFVRVADGGDNLHPADQLAQLAGKFKSMKVSKGGFEVTTNGTSKS